MEVAVAQFVCPQCPNQTWVMRQSLENQEFLSSPEPVYVMECTECRYSLLLRIACIQSIARH